MLLCCMSGSRTTVYGNKFTRFVTLCCIERTQSNNMITGHMCYGHMVCTYYFPLCVHHTVVL